MVCELLVIAFLTAVFWINYLWFLEFDCFLGLPERAISTAKVYTCFVFPIHFFVLFGLLEF